jgi:hypothetical protein
MEAGVRMIAAPATAASFWWDSSKDRIPIPAKLYEIQLASLYDHWDQLMYNPHYRIKTKDMEIMAQVEILHQFASRLLSESTEIDPEIARVVNEHFWELL